MAERVEDARRLLTLLCCATRPLTVSEVIEAIAVELGDNPHFNIDARLDNAEDIHQICPGFIEVDFQHQNISQHDKVDPTVRIAHFSVQEYLESERIKEHTAAAFAVTKLQAHTEMACVCLTYLLNLPPLCPTVALSPPQARSRSSSSSSSVATSRLADFPLSWYAAQCWYEHYVEGNPCLFGTEEQAIRLFRNARGELDQWTSIWDADEPFGEPLQDRNPLPLYYASFLGLYSIVSNLLCKDSPSCRSSKRDYILVNGKGGKLGNALVAASGGGYTTIVQLLLNHGAEVNAEGGYYDNALIAASHQGHTTTIQLLLDHGAEVNAKGGSFGNALIAASCQGHTTIVQLLLEHGAEVEMRGAYDETALITASYEGHTTIVQILLEHGAEVNTQGGNFGNALIVASRQGHTTIVQLLLEHDAEVDMWSACDESALSQAVLRNFDKIVQVLLEKGADVNTQCTKYGSALNAAVVAGNESIVRTLLENGAVVNAMSGYNGNALSRAAYEGHEQIVRLLLEKDADVNAPCAIFRNALTAAVLQGHGKIVGLLLRTGADINAKHGKWGKTALQYATVEGQEAMVRLLLENGADVSLTDATGRTALSQSAQQPHEKQTSLGIVKLLLAQSRLQPCPSPDFLQRPSAFYAAQTGNNKVLELLLAQGATDLNHRDRYGSTMLNIAVRNGQVDSIKYLLSFSGINKNVEDNFGRTPLSWALETKSHLIVNLLTGNTGTTGPLIGDGSCLADEEPYCYTSSSPYCDVCMVHKNGCEGYIYSCGICMDSYFLMCSDCFEVSAHCLDISHSLNKQIQDWNSDWRQRKASL